MGRQTALKKGTHLRIVSEGGIAECQIDEVIGYGGSSIVYWGRSLSAAQEARTQIIKEFYPQDIASIERRGTALFVPEEDRALFERRRADFLRGISAYSRYYEDFSGYTNPRPFLCGEADGTFCAISDISQGTVLIDANRDEFTLFDISRIMYSICSAIQNFHDNGLLYLDCKPENIYLYQVDQQYHVRLFDFDTVVSLADIRGGREVPMSHSKEWSPPEQRMVQRWREEVDKRSDIYSVGAVFFYLLTGKKPQDGKSVSSSDILKIERDRFKWGDRSERLGTYSDTAQEIVKRIISHTLQSSPEARYGDISRLMQDLHELSAVTKGDAIEDEAVYASMTKGFANVKKEAGKIQTALDKVKSDIEKTREKLNKQNKIVMLVLAVAVLVFGICAAVLGGRMGKAASYAGVVDVEGNRHLLLRLSNANHQYEVGLENWRRLDYARADRDIRTARDEISAQVAQSEMETAKVNNSLGCLYLDMGRYQEAYDFLNAAYVTFRDQLGQESVEARAAQASIAQYYFYTGNLDGALIETQYILDHSDAEREKEVIAATSHLRAMVYDAQGNWSQALALYQDVLELYDAIAEDGALSSRLSSYANDPELTQSEKDDYTNVVKWILVTYYNISQVDIHMGDSQAAADAAQQGLDMALSNIYIGSRNLITSKLYMSHAAAQGETGNLPEALHDVDLAMRIQMNIFNFKKVYPGLIEVYMLYGQLLEENREQDQALDFYQDAVDLALDSFGLNHPDTAAAYAALGVFHCRQGNYPDSVDLLEQAVEIRRNILAENHPDTAQMYAALALAQEGAGMDEAAVSSRKRADEIFESRNVTGQLQEALR